MKLTEDLAKAWLRGRGLPVPRGSVAASPEEARAAASALGGRVAVKALVAAGRRGKAGGVRLAGGPVEAADAAAAILGKTVGGHEVERVYVESAVAITQELYLSFAFGNIVPTVVVSRAGGVDIEAAAAADPGRIISRDIDPQRGLMPWHAADLWDRAGVDAALVPRLAALTADLFHAFRDADALMLEVNPLAVTADGLSIVGAMLEIDGNALFRHAAWRELALKEIGPGGRALNERELAVIAADRKFPGGAVRYTEVEGNIALMVSGGGAGLLQHDLMLAAGGRPANHSDMASTPTPDKPAAMLEAMLSNPAVRGLLISYNYLQLARCDMTLQALATAVEKCGVDTRRFPIVIRLFGPAEEEARRIAARLPGVRYLDHGASLADGVNAIVGAVREITEGKPQ